MEPIRAVTPHLFQSHAFNIDQLRSSERTHSIPQLPLLRRPAIGPFDTIGDCQFPAAKDGVRFSITAIGDSFLAGLEF